MQSIILERVLESARQHFLAGYVFEFLGTPLAGDYLVRHFYSLDLRLPIFDHGNESQSGTIESPKSKIENIEESDSGRTRNTRCHCYRCSVPGLAGFTRLALCGARSLMQAF